MAQKCHDDSIFLTAISICSRQFQFTHAISILLTAISICSRQFQLTHGNFNYLCLRLVQFTHGNFNLFTAISICPRQFQFTHGNFNFLTANNAHGIFRFAHHVKRQNQKSIFKVDLQSEKWKSKIENRFANTYASRQWVDNRRVLLVPENYKLYQTLTWWTVNIYCTASQNGSIPHINPSIEATSNCSKSCLLMLLVAVLLFLLRKSKNGGAIRKNMLFMDPVWDSFFVLYENGTVSDRHESNSCRVSDRDEVRPVWVHF